MTDIYCWRENQSSLKLLFLHETKEIIFADQTNEQFEQCNKLFVIRGQRSAGIDLTYYSLDVLVPKRKPLHDVELLGNAGQLFEGLLRLRDGLGLMCDYEFLDQFAEKQGFLGAAFVNGSSEAYLNKLSQNFAIR